jgi:hypothetical protein
VTETTLPPVDSRWRDTVGDDGPLTVVAHAEGYGVCHGQPWGEVWVHPTHFGDRYQPERRVQGGD